MTSEQIVGLISAIEKGIGESTDGVGAWCGVKTLRLTVDSILQLREENARLRHVIHSLEQRMRDAIKALGVDDE